MFQKLTTILLFSLVLNGCVSQPVEKPLSADDLAQVNERIINLEESLSNQFVASCTDNLKALETKLEELRTTKETTKVIERCTAPIIATPKTNDKFVVGEVEKVLLINEQLSFDARIDTGADTSSVGIFNLQQFERDGKKWVKFSLINNKDADIYEYPVFDTVKIKQTRSVTEERLEIKVDIEIGGKTYRNQIFNLAERDHLDYQLLIGRTFLRDIAIVDVAQKNLLDRD